MENKPLSAWPDNAKKQKVDIREYKCAKGESWIDVMSRARSFLRVLVEKHIIGESKKNGKTEIEKK